MYLMASTIWMVCVRPAPCRGRSDATMNCGEPEPFVIPPGQFEAGSACAPPPEVVDEVVPLLALFLPPQPAATSARQPTTPRSAPHLSPFFTDPSLSVASAERR